MLFGRCSHEARRRFSTFFDARSDGQKALSAVPEVVPSQSLKLDPNYELALLLPEDVRNATDAAEAYKLFFVLESYLRDLVVSILSKANPQDWWQEVPSDIQKQTEELEEREESKIWMATTVRDKSSLMTLPQLLKIIDDKWRAGFEEIIRDKSLVNQARIVVHLRNTICHMNNIPAEELSRIKQVMRDWFRMVPP